MPTKITPNEATGSFHSAAILGAVKAIAWVSERRRVGLSAPRVPLCRCECRVAGRGLFGNRSNSHSALLRCEYRVDMQILPGS